MLASCFGVGVGQGETVPGVEPGWKGTHTYWSQSAGWQRGELSKRERERAVQAEVSVRVVEGGKGRLSIMEKYIQEKEAMQSQGLGHVR